MVKAGRAEASVPQASTEKVQFGFIMETEVFILARIYLGSLGKQEASQERPGDIAMEESPEKTVRAWV